MSTVPLSPVSILTEDWYNGYTPRDEYYVPDGEGEVLDAYREYANGFSHDESSDLPLVLRDQIEADRSVLRFLHRDESDDQIMKRWNQPNDVLEELDDIEQNNERNIWIERMTAFRQAKLHKLLTDYFGTTDYASREIVLQWKPNPDKPGKFMPAEKVVVSEWIAAKVEEKGSRLAGFASCGMTLQRKIYRTRVAKQGREDWWAL